MLLNFDKFGKKVIKFWKFVEFICMWNFIEIFISGKFYDIMWYCVKIMYDLVIRNFVISKLFEFMWKFNYNCV